MPTRRTILRGVVAAVTAGSSRARPTPKKVAIFLPGLFGSTLTSKTGAGTTNIWSRDFCQLHERLRTGYNVLLTQATDTGVFDEAVVSMFGKQVYSRSYYKALLALLTSHDEFKRPGQFLTFSYDWRMPIPAVLDRFRRKLATQFGTVYDSKGIAAKQAEYEFYLIGHSLGAVLLTMAVAGGAIHPENIGNLILIAPPLMGSASAFRSLFDGFPLPVVSDLKNTFCFSWSKNRKIEEENLHLTLRQLPTGYQLMPPASDLFVRFGPSPQPFVNPLNSPIFSPKLGSQASAVHSEIAKCIHQMPLPPDRVHLLHGTGVATDQQYQVRTIKNRAGRDDLELTSVLPLADGDGTVTTRSALYDGQMKSKSLQYAITVAEHGTICEEKSVLDVIRPLL